MRSARSILKTAAFPLALGLASGGLCIAAAGEPLGSVLGSIAIAGLIIPPLAASEGDRWSSFFAAGAVIDGIALALLACAFAQPSSISFAQWLECVLVLAAFGLAIMALSRTIGMTLTVVLLIPWLTWPVWLAPHISGAFAAWLTPAHPLLAVNHVLLNHGAWTQQRLMYQFGTLGQDIAYTLPSSIWPCVIFHLVLASLVLWPGRSRGSSPALESKSAAAGC